MNDDEKSGTRPGPDDDHGVARQDAPADGPERPRDDLPPGVPEPPDIEKVRALRRRLEEERAGSSKPFRIGSNRRGVSLDEGTGRRAREISMYTIIPMMLLAGPAIGFLLGMFIEKTWGGAPWPTVAGALFGLAAAFRQIYLMLARGPDEGTGEKRS